MTFDGNTVEDNTTRRHHVRDQLRLQSDEQHRSPERARGSRKLALPGGDPDRAQPGLRSPGNTLDGNVHGIIGIQQNRTDDMVYGPHTLKNLWVHDNTVTHSGSGFAAGVGADYGDPFAAAANNKFDRNRYTTAATAPFAWAGVAAPGRRGAATARTPPAP